MKTFFKIILGIILIIVSFNLYFYISDHVEFLKQNKVVREIKGQSILFNREFHNIPSTYFYPYGFNSAFTATDSFLMSQNDYITAREKAKDFLLRNNWEIVDEYNTLLKVKKSSTAIVIDSQSHEFGGPEDNCNECFQIRVSIGS